MALTGALAIGCGVSSPWPVTAHEVQKAPPALAAIRILVTGDPDLNNPEFVAAMKVALRGAGISVVRDYLEPWDYEFIVTYNGHFGNEYGLWLVTAHERGWVMRWELAHDVPSVRNKYVTCGSSRCWPYGVDADSPADAREYARLEEELTVRCRDWKIDRPNEMAARDGHLRAATTIVNAMIACPELERLAQFAGSRGLLASGTRFNDPVTGAPWVAPSVAPKAAPP